MICLYSNIENDKIKKKKYTIKEVCFMDYDKKVIVSVNNKLESAMKELESLDNCGHEETIQLICEKIKETIINLDALSKEE